ncbi:AAA family ATPase [Natranaerofaba carboxydovora]|uniref:AAA family ATPase n=1 Tax=Natranaerofaba carboxydovora TaxID=2742683 RepID=UPI001F1303C1|nr:AAA family ATPase [Natranaerofaba carboxydovora]UMZ72998.1 Type-2 restriction enzyme BsuMI component YdiS [Natranaerofaba carboxydovora]
MTMESTNAENTINFLKEKFGEENVLEEEDVRREFSEDMKRNFGWDIGGAKGNSDFSFYNTRKITVPSTGEEIFVYAHDTTYYTSNFLINNFERKHINNALAYSIDKGCKFFFLSVMTPEAIENLKTKNHYLLEKVEPSELIFSIEGECKHQRSYTFDPVINEWRNKGFPIPGRAEAPTKKGLKIKFMVLHKENLDDYLEYFDSRPYMRADTKNKSNEQTKIKEVEKINKSIPPIKFSRNRLLFGAPGTGKSHKIDNELEKCRGEYLYKEESKIEEIVKNLGYKDEETYSEIKKKELREIRKIDEDFRVTFFEEYTYHDFVGAYKPVPEGDNITYKFVPGPFTEALVQALNYPYKNVLLIIEEINRANAASVFGDLIQLLDRTPDGDSKYSIVPPIEMKKYLLENDMIGRFNEDEGLKIPENLYIWATMNSADQGVFPIDSAFKRRWTVEYMPIDGEENDVERYHVWLKLDKEGEFKKYKWNSFRKELNKLLKNYVEEDRLIGPYFLNNMDLGEDNETFTKEAVVNKLFSYLRQDVLRYTPDKIFNNNLSNMTDIKEAYYDDPKPIDYILKDFDSKELEPAEEHNSDDNNDEPGNAQQTKDEELSDGNES